MVAFTPYGPDSLSTQLAELQTDYLDLLVIHSRDDESVLRKEMELAMTWRKAGLAREVGLGMARVSDLDALPVEHPFTHVLAPYSAFNTEAEGLFHLAKSRGMSTIAMSPFVRGWKLDRPGVDRTVLAALLLRWVMSQEVVDTVFVSMRKAEWVIADYRAEQAGALSDEEEIFVREIVAHSG
jgi:aryl-alcohol dehydrogenase-like predicted oxidoreductase